MATCSVLLDFGYGNSIRFPAKTVGVTPFESFTDGTMKVLDVERQIPLTNPPSSEPFIQGQVYRFTEPNGDTLFKTIPATTTAVYADIAEIYPVPSDSALLTDALVDAAVVGDDLIVEHLDGHTTNAGNVRGPVGPTGNVLTGTGSPEGVVTANVGTLYSDTASTLGASVWRKASGTGNTWWVVIDGDTGERNVSADLISPFVSNGSSSCWLARIGAQVTLLIQTTANTAASSAVINLPVGFRPTKSQVYVAAHAGVSAVVSTAGGVSPAAAASSLRWSIGWTTRDAWPTSLPGTAG